MATLALSTVGTALGGPFGGLLGSLVGQSIDQQLLGGAPRRGPRLGELQVQGSTYGSPIPRIYGAMRVAGTVVWSTDLKESSELQGDGKSQPETVVYTYSVSFAVALSSRPARSVRRIWADGKLIRGISGDLKVPAKFRFYPGDEGQDVDPLIATIEGADQTPAYRGLALAVFEDLQLGTFGNRIPALTFEIIGDEPDGIELGSLLTDASDGAIQCDEARRIGGYAAYGESAAAAVAPLIETFAIDLADDGAVLQSPQPGSPIIVTDEQLGADAGFAGSARFARELAPADNQPAAITLSFYEPGRDYQAGQVRISSPSPSRTTRSLMLAAALTAGNAKIAAESLLLRAWALRERIIVRLPLSFLDVRPGTLVSLSSIAGTWVAETVDIEQFVVVVTLRPEWASPGDRTADPGRSNAQPDIVAEPTRLALFDLPDPETSHPVLALAAASPSGAWRPVPIEVVAAGTVTASRSAAGEAVLGQSLASLGDGQAALVDRINAFDVQLANPDHWLQSRDDADLAMGANLAAIGNELIQFADAEPLGAGAFRLSTLLRGRRGSEWAMNGHGPNEPFALLDAGSLKPIALPIEMLGTAVAVKALGAGDLSSPPVVSRVANGEAMRPLSPTHLSAEVIGDGSVILRWLRRSRLAWTWMDEIEAPAGAGAASYRVKASGSGGVVEREVGQMETGIGAADLAALGPGAIQIEVREVGNLALSRPATVTLNR